MKAYVLTIEDENNRSWSSDPIATILLVDTSHKKVHDMAKKIAEENDAERINDEMWHNGDSCILVHVQQVTFS